MLLVDTSVWVEHFRHGISKFAESLSEGLVVMHPFIFGELACGNLQNRTAVLANLNTLASVEVAGDSEVLHLIESRKLWGRSIGWVDAHLLAAALLSHCRFWTLDERLAQAADDLGLSFRGAPA